MNPAPLPQDVTPQTIKTARITTHALVRGSREGTPVIFLHGNLSSSRFFADLLAVLPGSFFGVAPDMRGFGATEKLPLDATRGLLDFSDDLKALVDTLELTSGGRKLHLVGWSVGGSVAMQYAISHPGEVASLTLICPMSPFGFGGTKDAQGTPCFDDFAGSGAGTANPDFVKRLAAKDSSEESDFSPRRVMNTFYFKPPFRVEKDLEDAFVEAMLSTAVGEENYPGDVASSANWPSIAPGTKGMNNAISAKYCNLRSFIDIEPKPPVLWVRGENDQIVSDTSLFDFGYLGQLGALPGWPGAEVYPAQPMVSQTRFVLDQYRAKGGEVREEVFANCGHSPFLENPGKFQDIFFSFLQK